MSRLEVHHGLPLSRLSAAALTIGSFDGLHLGHQAVISNVTAARGSGLLPVLVTFEPHPRCVLDPDNCPKSITTLEEKLGLLHRLELEHAIVLLFNRDLAAVPAADFMDRLLAAADLKLLVTGPDFALGRGREGDVEWLRRHGDGHGYEVRALDPTVQDGRELHSSEIRRLITLGEVDAANELLGRWFSMLGTVEHGHKVGRGLGFPTVNLSMAPNKLVPGPGVYAGKASQGSREWGAAIGVGYRPTFGGTELTVEAYLLDFEGDLYQQRLEVAFGKRLRDEVKFDSAEALARQMAADVDATRTFLAGA